MFKKTYIVLTITASDCELLLTTLTTNSQCAAKLTAGECVTKDFCSYYKTQVIS